MSEFWKKRIYTFNIIAEAKARTLVIMTRKVHPDWTLTEIEDFLKRLIGHAVDKQAKEDVLGRLVGDTVEEKAKE